jgi:hypothetical protein
LRKNGAFDKTLNNGTTFSIESGNTYEIAFSAPNNTTKSYSSIMVEVGSTATSYEPYNASTVTIALGQTVYGGERNITTGLQTVTHANLLLSDATWRLQSINSHGIANFYTIISGRKNGASDLCDRFTKQTSTIADTITEGFLPSYSSGTTTLYIRIDSTRASTVAEFSTWLENNETHFVYELAQPVTVQLTPTEIETLLGINNIWADTGDTTVTYYTSSADDVIDLVQYDTTKQDKLTAGTGITIDSSNVISATGGGGGAVIDHTTTSTTSVWSSSKTNSEIEATAAQILVPEFSTTKSYRSDDLCLHGGKFYMAMTDISAGAWDATKWAEQTLHDVLEFYSEAAVAWADIDDLGNVQVDNLANGKVLKYNSTTQRWENANESGGGASALNDLSDVSVPSPTAGQVLTYQIAASVGQWIASPVPTPWFELTETVPAAQDPTNPDTVSIAFRDSRITANSTVDVYTSVQGKNYVSLGIVTGRISISYVTGQSSFEVKVRVS